jgi:polyferredoxin
VCLLCFPAGHAIAAVVIPIPILIILWGTGLAELAMMAILLGVAVIIFVWQFWSLRN